MFWKDLHYIIFMPVCFESFDVSHNFLKTAALVRNHVVCMSQTNLFLKKLASEWWAVATNFLQFVFWNKMQ